MQGTVVHVPVIWCPSHCRAVTSSPAIGVAQPMLLELYMSTGGSVQERVTTWHWNFWARPFTCWGLPVPWSSLFLVLEHRHCWELLSKAGSAVLAIAVKYFTQVLEGPARKEFIVCYSCKPHKKMLPIQMMKLADILHQFW